MAIDDLDLQLISLLKAEPRAATRSLARALKLSEPNVATRISQLESSGILRVMAVVDMHTVGYQDVVILGIRVSNQHPDEVAMALIGVPEVMGLNSTFGRYQLVGFMLARDKHHLGTLLDRIGTIAGVQDLEACLVLDVLRSQPDVGKLSLFEEQHLPDLPHDHATPDQLDMGIIKVLQENGRMSFREVGRRLATPEATIRSRLTRLEQSDAMRLVTVTDSDALIPEKATAWIALRVRGGALDDIAKHLSEVADIGLVFTTIGRFNLVALVLRPTRPQLLDFISQTVAPMQGIQQLEVWETVHIYKHDIRIAIRLT